jgi:hypothetical protein
MGITTDRSPRSIQLDHLGTQFDDFALGPRFSTLIDGFGLVGIEMSPGGSLLEIAASTPQMIVMVKLGAKDGGIGSDGVLSYLWQCCCRPAYIVALCLSSLANTVLYKSSP